MYALAINYVLRRISEKRGYSCMHSWSENDPTNTIEELHPFIVQVQTYCNMRFETSKNVSSAVKWSNEYF